MYLSTLVCVLLYMYRAVVKSLFYTHLSLFFQWGLGVAYFYFVKEFVGNN